MPHEVFKYQLSPFDQSKRVERMFEKTDARNKGICKGLAVQWLLSHMTQPLNLSSQRMAFLRETFMTAGDLQKIVIDRVQNRTDDLNKRVLQESERRMELFSSNQLQMGLNIIPSKIREEQQFSRTPEEKEQAVLEDNIALLKAVGLRLGKVCPYENDFGKIAEMLEGDSKVSKWQHFLISVQHETQNSAALSAHAWCGYMGSDGLHLFDPIRGEFWCSEGTKLLYLLFDEYKSHHRIHEVSMLTVEKA